MLINIFTCVSVTKDAAKYGEGVIWSLFHGTGFVAVAVVAGHMRSWTVCLGRTPGGWETTLWKENDKLCFFTPVTILWLWFICLLMKKVSTMSKSLTLKNDARWLPVCKPCVRPRCMWKEIRKTDPLLCCMLEMLLLGGKFDYWAF